MSYLNKSYPNLRDAFPRSPGGETKDEAAIAISAHQARAGDVAISSSAEVGQGAKPMAARGQLFRSRSRFISPIGLSKCG